MAQYKLRTFKDILDAVREEIKLQSTSTVDENRIKRDINIIYEDVASRANWEWLKETIAIEKRPLIQAGTVDVIQSSKTITLSVAPSFSVAGFKFSPNQSTEIYEIETHTANATTATLTTKYSGETSTGLKYKIWTDAIPLPTNLRETFEVAHNYNGIPLEGKGLQEFRRISQRSPKAEGRPSYYSTSKYIDPDPYSAVSGITSVTRSSSGLVRTVVFDSDVSGSLEAGDWIKITGAGDDNYTGEFKVSSVATTTTASDTITYTANTYLSETSTADAGITASKLTTKTQDEKYRNLIVYPGIFDKRLTLTVDYITEIVPLEADSDEPLMPVHDRAVLLYGALSRAWRRERDSDEANNNLTLYERKIADMEGKWTDSLDSPILRPSSIYLSTKRRSGSQVRFGGRPRDVNFPGGGSAASVPTGVINTAAIFNSAGELQGSGSISTTELNQLDGILSSAVGISDTQTLTNKTIDADSNTITNIDNTEIKAAAGIEFSKMEDLTSNRALVSDANGDVSVSDITDTEITFLDEVEALTTFAMNDNQSTAADVATWAHASFDSIKLDYSISRGSGNIENGIIHIVTDGTNAAISQTANNLGTIGVTFTVDISGANVRLRYTSTSTGTAPSMKYKVHKWQA